MSIKNSQKEMILTLYLKKYKGELERVIGLELSNIELERSNGGKKIDYYAVNKHRRLEVFLESQVTPSNMEHLVQKVKPIIMSLSEGLVVWLATQFNPEHIKAVRSLLKDHRRQKYINFYAVEINQTILPVLDQLNTMYKLDIWSNLDLINQIQQPFRLVDWHKQIPHTHVGKAVAVNQYDFTRLDDVKNYTLEKLRERLPQYINLHKAKKHNESNRRIVIGGGRDGINYNCSVQDRRNLAYVELHFSHNQKILYEWLVNHYVSIRERVHPDIVMGKGRIGVYFKPCSDLQDTVQRIAEILEKMITYFTPYTCYWDNRNLNLMDGEKMNQLESKT